MDLEKEHQPKKLIESRGQEPAVIIRTIDATGRGPAYGRVVETRMSPYEGQALPPRKGRLGIRLVILLAFIAFLVILTAR